MNARTDFAISFVISFAAAAVAGCSSGGSTSTTLDMTSAGCMPHEVKCTDQSVQQLNLFRPVNMATITDTVDGTTHSAIIDATGGGTDATKSYVYAKFSDAGLTRVDVGDEDAFMSSGWDIALRRFIVRLNSGISGPSCVTAARTATGTTFDGLTSVPDGLDYRTEEYFDDACNYVPDGSGLMSPGTALQSFWQYPGCVAMTGNVFILQLADGHKVKLQVIAYYTPQATQDACNNAGTMPSGTASAHYTIKWSYL